MHKPMARVCVAVALACAVSQAAGMWLVFSGDSKAARAVDVRDLQQTVARVLHGGAVGGESDVNGDGRVDVLDVLALLEKTTHAGVPHQKPSHQGGQDEGVLTSSTALLRLAVPERRAIHLIDTGETASLPNRPWTSDHPIIPARTERYVCCLISNAPPARA